MKIESCHIFGFGVLQNRSFSFRDGLNVLCLPNGAGKSTLAGFIKCMLYGLSDTKKQSVAENERKRFAPFGGGAFGGTMTFSTADGRYTIERTFGRRASDDTFTLYDAGTGRRSTRYPTAVGEALFGLDAEAFERVFFLSERELVGKNESIARRLASPAEQAGLSEGLSGALDRLETERRRLSRRGGGVIEETEERIAALTAQIRELREQANTAAEVRTALSETERCLCEADGTAEYRTAAKKERERTLAALREEEAALCAFFRAGIPKTEEIRAAEHILTEEMRTSPSSSFAKKLRLPLFFLTLALGALGVAITLVKSPAGYVLLLPAACWIFSFFFKKIDKKAKNSLRNRGDALKFLSKYPCKSPEPFEEIRRNKYRIEEVRRAIGARENEEYERVTSPPSLETLYRERAVLEDKLKQAKAAALLLEEKENDVASLTDHLARDKARLSVLQKTKELLLRADEELSKTYLSRIEKGLVHYAASLDAASELIADSELHLTKKANGMSLPLEIMSRGERALSGLALRFSLADALGGEPSFLLLDDPFLSLDDEKIEKALGLLSSLSEERQILYLTCSASRVP